MKETQKKTDAYVLDLVNRASITFENGEGSYLIDTNGRRYLDFLCGVAVTSLGHSHPDIVRVIQEQSQKLLHVSNLFYIPEQAQLAEELVKHSFPSKAFFLNSGTEANEAAFKLCRSYGQKRKGGAFTFLSLQNSFHGRTVASMCLTGQNKIYSGFGPLLEEGHKHIPANSLDALEKEIEDSYKNKKEICAFFVELIQGEGGIFSLDHDYVSAAYELCKQHNILFVVDEVQTGMGRTASLFCYEHYGIVPDILILGKALGSGIPISALLVSNRHKQYLEKGQHGNTLGGNPFATRVALETLRIMKKEGFLENVEKLSRYIFERLGEFRKKYSIIREIRGKGFHIGLGFEKRSVEFVERCREEGLILNATIWETVRVMPPLNLKIKEADEGLAIMDRVFSKL